LRARTILTCGAVAVALIGAVAWYLDSEASPGCASEPALHQVTDQLREQFHLDGVFVNDIRTVAGGWFSHRRACSAQIAVIRGNVNASDMPWREIRYQIEQRASSGNPTITVSLEGTVPLAQPAPSLWERLLAWL
jgi:hypothetical protein